MALANGPKTSLVIQRQASACGSGQALPPRNAQSYLSSPRTPPVAAAHRPDGVVDKADMVISGAPGAVTAMQSIPTPTGSQSPTVAHQKSPPTIVKSAPYRDS